MNENENESGSSSSFQTRKENDDEEDNNGEEVFEDPTTDRTDPMDAVTLKERLSLVSQVTRVQSPSEYRTLFTGNIRKPDWTFWKSVFEWSSFENIGLISKPFKHRKNPSGFQMVS